MVRERIRLTIHHKHSALLIIALGLMLTLLLNTTSPAWASTLYEYYDSGTSYVDGVYGTRWFAQAFTVGAARHTVTSISLHISSATTGTCTVSIRATSSGLPTGSDLTSGTYACNNLVAGWYSFSVTTYTLSANTQYAIVLQYPAVQTYWYYSLTYVAGASYSTDSGSTWNSLGDRTYGYEIYGDPIYHTITFALSGVGSDASGTILTIDSTGYTYADFPKDFSWGEGSTHSVAATTPASTGSSKQYVWSSWTNGDGLSGASGTYTTPSSDTTVTATYAPQYPSASPSDSLHQSESLGRNFIGGRASTDSSSVTDLIGTLRNVPNVLSEVLAWQDTLTLLWTHPRQLSDQLNLADMLGRNFIGARSSTEASTITDLIKESNSKVLSDLLAWQDSVARSFVNFNALLSDQLTLTDSLTFFAPKYPFLSESMQLSDSVTRGYVGGRLAADILSIVDLGATGQRAVTRIMADVLSITDSLVHLGPPATPSAVSATQNLVNPQGSIDLTWTETDTYAGMTYSIDKSPDQTTWVSAGTSSTTSFTASGLTSGYGWYFRIRAYNGQYSTYSSTVLGVTGTIPITSLGGGGQPTPSYGLVVKIVDLNAVPVSGASVTVGSWSLLSDSTGIANFGPLTSGTYTLDVTSSGCQAANQTINLNSNHDLANPLQVSLTCGSQQTTSTGTALSNPQIEGILWPILGTSLLLIAGVAIFESRKKKTRKKERS